MLIVIGSVAITGSYFTSEYSRVYYTDVRCNGDEQQLTDCSSSTYSMYNRLEDWYYSNRAGAACETNSSAGNTYSIS